MHTQRNSLKVFFTVFFGTYQVTIVLQVAVLQFVIFILVLIWGAMFLSLLNQYITGFCMRSVCYISQCVKVIKCTTILHFVKMVSLLTVWVGTGAGDALW